MCLRHLQALPTQHSRSLPVHFLQRPRTQQVGKTIHIANIAFKAAINLTERPVNSTFTSSVLWRIRSEHWFVDVCGSMGHAKSACFCLVCRCLERKLVQDQDGDPTYTNVNIWCYLAGLLPSAFLLTGLSQTRGVDALLLPFMLHLYHEVICHPNMKVSFGREWKRVRRCQVCWCGSCQNRLHFGRRAFRSSKARRTAA